MLSILAFTTSRAAASSAAAWAPLPRLPRRLHGRARRTRAHAAAEAQPVRLDKLLCDRGAADSRKAAGKLLRSGRVALADGAAVKAATKALPSQVTLDGLPLEAPPPLLAAYHKPYGVLSVLRDPQGRPCLGDCLLPQMPPGWARALHPVGRLDMDSTGLLLFSSSGQLTNTLLHPKKGVPRVYVAGLSTPIPDGEGLRARLEAGIATSDGTYPAELLDWGIVEQDDDDDDDGDGDGDGEEEAREDDATAAEAEAEAEAETAPVWTDEAVAREAAEAAAVAAAAAAENETLVSDEEWARLTGEAADDDDADEDGFDADEELPPAVAWARVRVKEGKYRMVRRMLANAGHPVVELHRESYGSVDLDELGLEEGEMAAITGAGDAWAKELEAA